MSNFEFKDPLIYQLRSGTSNDPFRPFVNYPYKIVKNIVLLEEIPNPIDKVQIHDLDSNQLYYEVEHDDIGEFEYKVNYTIGFVRFHPSVNGKTLSFTYTGRGVVLIPVERIYTKETDGVIGETLGDFLNDIAKFHYIGEYNSADKYDKYNIVTYQGASYLSLENTNLIPTNEYHWVRISGFKIRGVYNPTTAYFSGDIVSNEGNNSMYYSLVNNNTGNNLTDAAKWRILIDAQTAIDSAYEAAEYANTQGEFAEEQGNYAKSQGEFANTQGDFAKEVAKSIIHKGNYSSSTLYVIRNIVSYQGSTFMCIQDTTGNSPDDIVYWAKITGYRWMGTYSPSTAYQYGDSVVDAQNQNIYHSISNNNLNHSLESSLHWQKIIGVQASVESANAAAEYAIEQGDYAKDQGEYAKTQGDYAKTQGEFALEKGQYAEEQGDYSKEQGNFAQNVGESLVWKGVFDEAIGYVKRNIVGYLGSTYMCIQSGTGNLPNDTNYWVKIAGYDWKGMFSPTVDYRYGDIVTDSVFQNVYQSNSDSNTNQPLSNTAYWVKLISVTDIVATTELARDNAKLAADNANNAAENAQSVADETKGLGEYNSSTTYSPNNIVTLSGSSYMALDTVPGITPGTDATKWQLIAAKGLDGTGAGTVVSVTSVNSDIAISDPSDSVVLTLNSDVNASSNTVVKRDAGGRIKAEVPVADKDVANKKYVDEVSPVKSVAGKTGDVILVASDLGAEEAGSSAIVQDNLDEHITDNVSHTIWLGTTEGTSTAYVASNSKITSLVDGMRISFKAHVTSGINPRITINSATESPLLRPNGKTAKLEADGVYTAVYYSSTFILQGEGGEEAELPGVEWTIRNSAADNNWRSVCYGNGLFVAVALSGTGNRVMTSPDGISWTIRNSAADNNWRSVCYGNGLFVAIAHSGTGNRVMTSPDGINWTIRNSAADERWSCVCYGNGLYLAVADSNSGNRIMTSPDGINWTLRTSAANNSWTSVCYGNGLFVAVALSGTENRVMTSPDGINWTLRTSPSNNNWISVCYGNGLFVAVATGTTSGIMISSDGIYWTLRTSATNNSWYSVCYGNGLFVAVASTNLTDSFSGKRVMTSPDGINWTLRNSSADNAWQSVCYGNGLFVAIARSGLGNRVMTSSISGELGEYFAEVSNGKELIANAITDKGVSTSATDSFQTMSSNIKNISIGVGNAQPHEVLQGKTFTNDDGQQTGTVTNLQNSTVDANPENVSDEYLIAKQPEIGIVNNNTSFRIFDPNFIPSNIKAGTSIFGLDGTYAGETSIAIKDYINAANNDFSLVNDPTGTKEVVWSATFLKESHALPIKASGSWDIDVTLNRTPLFVSGMPPRHYIIRANAGTYTPYPGTAGVQLRQLEYVLDDFESIRLTTRAIDSGNELIINLTFTYDQPLARPPTWNLNGVYVQRVSIRHYNS
ncbi:hypothetical protein EBB07_06010 [Paenibacillaceae bacterium]|nr:hypothetical protein EBB07_06010 [Paenibacillaceae bacterium]